MNRITLPYLILSLFFNSYLWGQSPVNNTKDETNGAIFKINKIVPNEKEKTLEIFLTAQFRNTAQVFEKDATFYTVRELRKSPSKDLGVRGFGALNQVTVAQNGHTTMLVLVDISGSMIKENKLGKAKEALEQLLNNPALSKIHKQYAYFYDDIGDTYDLNPQTIQRINSMNSSRYFDTDLNRAIVKKLDELKAYEGNKILVLLTDGVNDVDEKYYKSHNITTRVSTPEVYNKVINLDSSFQIIPMGIGKDANQQFLDSLSICTKNPDDFYLFGTRPEKIADDLKYISESVVSNLVLKVAPDPGNCTFGNETREFQVIFNKGDEVFEAKKLEIFSRNFKSFDLCADHSVAVWLPFVIGVLILGLMLLFFTLLMPYLFDRAFRKKHIRKYYEVKRPNVVSRDPLTMQPIADYEEVVVMDNKIMLYETWKYVMSQGEGGISTTHAEFFKNQVKGNFFDQKSSYRQLNWLWFGALGGFFAWVFSFLFSLNWNQWPWLGNLLNKLNSDDGSIGEKMYQAIFFGLSLGLSFLLFLALVEELGQSRKFSIWRVILRMLLGGLLGVVALFLSKWLIQSTMQINIPSYFRDLIDWMLFGVVMGCALSILSSIRFKIGLIAGLVASLIAFHIFELFQLIKLSHFIGQDLSLVFGLIIYGGITGYFIHTIVQRFEDFELQILLPKEFMGQVRAVSKFLKAGQYPFVTIGTHPSSEIYIKWQDEGASSRHAKMSYQNGVVYIEPNEGPIYINGSNINRKTPLKNLDKIHLGPQSITIFQFMSKEASADASGQIPEYSKGGINIKLQNLGQQQTSGQTSRPGTNTEVRKKIKISPRKK